MEKLRFIGTHEELYELTGSGEKARILRQFIYWTVRTKDVKGYLEEMALRDRAEEIENSPAEKLCDNHEFGWIFKKVSELKWEIMSDLSEPSLRKKINELVSEEWVWERRNPNYKWDKTLQYRVNLVQLEHDLNALGYSLSTVMGGDFPIVKNLLSKQSDLASRQKIELSEQKIEFSKQSDLAAIPETTTEITNKDYNKRGGEARPQEKPNVKQFSEETSDNGSAKAVNFNIIDPVENQDQDRSQFSADCQILPKKQQRNFWRALTAYIEKTNPNMSRGRAESIASASTERLLNHIPKVQDQEYLDMYLQGILPCYIDDRINYQTIKEHQTLEELRGMLYDE